ncbi:MAG: diguanylate cyclase domain-containing protein [Lachnospiraceae bacterium]
MKSLRHSIFDRRSLPYRVYLILVALFFLLLVYVGITAHTKITKTRQYATRFTIQDVTQTRVADDESPAGYYDSYRFALGNLPEDNLSLAFYTVHSDVEVLLSGNVIYRFTREAGSIGKTPGNTWHVVNILASDSNQNVEVRVIPVYKNLQKTGIVFYVGERSEIVMSEMIHATPIILISAMLILTSLFLLAISCIPFMTANILERAELRYLSLFCIMLGIWQLSDLRAASLLFPNSTVLFSDITMSCLILMPFSVFELMRCTVRRHETYYRVGELIYLGFAGLFFVMQVFGIRDFRQNLTFLHILIAISIVTTLAMGLWDLFRMRNRSKLFFTILAFLMVTIGMAADLYRYYKVDTAMESTYLLLAMLFFLVFRGVSYLLQLRRDAIFDRATGLYNKNLCQKAIGTPGPAAPGIIFYMFDLNGLKTVNDKKGHEAGDQMIAGFAGALKKASQILPGAFCGRFGGDEFILFFDGNKLEPGTEEAFQSALAQMTGSACSLAEPGYCYAFGRAAAADYPGEPLEVLMRKADQAMYQNKKAWYSQPGHNRRRES